MSRSAYVWVVTLDDEVTPPAAVFTVKHECAAWLARQNDLDWLTVWRFRDSYHHPGNVPVRLDPVTLEEIR